METQQLLRGGEMLFGQEFRLQELEIGNQPQADRNLIVDLMDRQKDV